MLSRAATGATPAVIFLGFVLALPLYDLVVPTAEDLLVYVKIPGGGQAGGGDGGGDAGGGGAGGGGDDGGRVDGAGLVEGEDWSYITPERGKVAWPCDDAIKVVLVGPAPEGAAEAVHTVVERMMALSGLPLEVGEADVDDDGDAWRDGEILVRYVDPRVKQAPSLEFTDDSAIGLGGPVSSGNTISAGRVALRVDQPHTDSTDPTTAGGRDVLLHELGHAIGAGHSVGLPYGVMAESGSRPRLTRGDRYVFRLLGCPR